MIEYTVDGVDLTRWIRVSHQTDAEMVCGSSSAGSLGPLGVCGRSAGWASRQLIGETGCARLHTDFTSVILVSSSGLVWDKKGCLGLHDRAA